MGLRPIPFKNVFPARDRVKAFFVAQMAFKPHSAPPDKLWKMKTFSSTSAEPQYGSIAKKGDTICTTTRSDTFFTFFKGNKKGLDFLACQF